METAADQSMEPPEPKKQVRWGTVSVLEFRVGYSASAVPESGGPPVGLIGRPTRLSYSMIPAEEDVEGTDSECESFDSDPDAEMLLLEATPRPTGRGRRSSSELWLDPMERARVLAEEHAFPLEDIALICRDVRATLDSRTLSRLDEMAEKALEASRVQRKDVRPLRCGGGGVCSSTREKVLLY
ncbi:hypothetical protein PHYPSEUDO_001815 [Phytophthora pseudosyringae]|uniref:Uncharacterized protein n=1 Tax=Phytophthora pseudosyringae TaxID=221518 RepID=A0A8T1V5J3_9STRA|nr:hypothetical protein PHYPSEUDO_001815 [Phytophthora pseudosyringae]